jgi:hypothetical protein
MKATCHSNEPAVQHLAKMLSRSSYIGNNQYKLTLQRALKSLCAYPLKIESEKEAQLLEGVGPSISKEIMKALNSSEINQKGPAQIESEVPTTSICSSKVYKPEYGHGPWAIIIGLRLIRGEGTKSDIKEVLQKHNILVI